MKWLRNFSESLSQLRELRERFADLVLKERRLLLLACVALTGEIVCTAVAPLSIKYITDGYLLYDEEAWLPGVPAGYGVDHPYLFVTYVCLALLVVAVVGGFCSYFRQVWAATAGQRMVFKLRKRLYDHLHRLSLRFHTNRRLGDLLVRITGDIPMLRDILSESFVDLIGRLVLVAVFLVILFVIEPILAVISVAVLLLVGVMSGFFGRRIVKVTRKQREMEGILAYTAGETLSAMALVKAYGREDEVVRRFARQNRSSMRKGLKGTRLQAALSRWVELAFAIGIVLVLGLGVMRVHEGLMTAGSLLAFLSYVRGLNKPLRKAARISARVGKAAACGERILEILAIEREEVDLPGARTARGITGELSFDDVEFSYEDGEGTEIPALRGVRFHVAAGERIGIVGRNGAGKSTLLHLLFRFYEPSRGEIRLDGKDIRELTIESLRDQMSLALQSTLLLGTTVRDNLLFADPDANEEEMLVALSAVGADFVARLESGLDAEISEGGANLSGGERRKIALAAAILRDAPILVLDEPTTSIDRASRRDLLERLPALTVERTTLMITHDPDMLGWLDRIVYVEDGRVTGVGRHEELQATIAGYRSLFPHRPDPREEELR